ncbi:EF-P lysine aminoacylase EpmA [Marinimicrobium sp. C2-29]|uniref:EF-P lysine aminoacylase EpmA n=1 Tax=Marinimicrobium sp. C2-29 TaxID=3139825 RepID=UPI003139293E
MTDWRPSASLFYLQARARLYRQIREFFTARAVMEIEAPVMGAAAVTDPYIESVSAQCDGRTYYLQTSPEFAMKRLLAAGSGPIYALGKVFRNGGEYGRRHNPEFTLLEWYRPGWNDHQLMDEVEALLLHLRPGLEVARLSYREWFQSHLAVDPHTASAAELAAIARGRIEIDVDGPEAEDRDLWLDLLVTHELEATLGPGLTFVYDYPQSQAALARIEPDSRGQRVARRFEAFIGGMELANGYWELTDAGEQRRRFAADRDRREALGLTPHAGDPKLLAALEQGLPDSAGVALGVDRLLMCLHGARTISEVIPFDLDAL